MKTIDEIFEYVKHLIENEKTGGKITLARMYGAYEREMEEIQKEQEVEGHIYERDRGNVVLHKVSDSMWIVEYKPNKRGAGFDREMYVPYRDGIFGHEARRSFDEALLACVAMKTKSESAVPYIARMLELDKEVEQ